MDHKSCDHYSYSLFKIMSIIKRVVLTYDDGDNEVILANLDQVGIGGYFKSEDF